MKGSRRAARNYDRRYSEVDSLRGKMKKRGMGSTQIDIRWKFGRCEIVVNGV